MARGHRCSRCETGGSCMPSATCRSGARSRPCRAPSKKLAFRHISALRCRAMRRRRTVTLWGALLCLAILPATASAGNWDSSTGLQYDGEPGEANHVTVQFDGASVTVTDTAGVRPYGAYWCVQNPEGVGCPYDPSGGVAGDPERCTQLSANSFRCPYTGNLGFFYLQDGNDSLTYSGPAPALPGESSNYGEQLNVFGGEGDDTITGSPYVDALEGDFNSGSGTGAGSDRINGGGGNDQIGTGR